VASEPRTKADYFEAGLELLAEGGAAALTIANLCDRLGVTKGSYYHHFPSQPAFHRELLDQWLVERFEQLQVQVDSIEDPLDRIELLKQLGLQVNHRAESAIRAWARTNPDVAAAQRRMDDAREQALRHAFVDAGIDDERASTLARIGATILVGTQSLEDPVDRDRLEALFDEYQRWLLASAGLAARR
jgi:AcrR family transcriptional regulator